MNRVAHVTAAWMVIQVFVGLGAHTLAVNDASYPEVSELETPEVNDAPCLLPLLLTRRGWLSGR